MVASVLCLVFMMAEVVGGVMSNSLAIATDAAHLLTGFTEKYLTVDTENYFRLRLLHDIIVCTLDVSQTQESEDVVWLAPSRGAGSDSLGVDDLGGDGGPGVHGSHQAGDQGV